MNGAVQVTMTTVGGVATYTCNTGFDLVGVSRRTCQTNGVSAQWSDNAPQCNRESHKEHFSIDTDTHFLPS